MQNILYLGPQASNSYIAAEKFVELENLENINLIPKGSIKNIIDAVDENQDLIAVVPIENSIEGIVRETMDNLIRTADESVVISRELILPISNCLISKAKEISQIKTIVSHPQAIAQCHGFISKFFHDDVKIINSSSTSDAVKSLIEQDETFAAIANAKAAEYYSIPVLEKSISDDKDNKTRFVCLSRQQKNKTDNDKTSLVFATDNKPGALVEALKIFQDLEINLSYIDSRPSKKNFGTYTFFVDCEVHSEDEKFKEALNRLRKTITFYRFLGSFPKSLDLQ